MASVLKDSGTKFFGRVIIIIMSTKGYSKKSYKVFVVKCVYILNRVPHIEKRVSYASCEEEAIAETYSVHLWSMHPTFMCGVIGSRVYYS